MSLIKWIVRMLNNDPPALGVVDNITWSCFYSYHWRRKVSWTRRPRTTKALQNSKAAQRQCQWCSSKVKVISSGRGCERALQSPLCDRANRYSEWPTIISAKCGTLSSSQWCKPLLTSTFFVTNVCPWKIIWGVTLHLLLGICGARCRSMGVSMSDGDFRGCPPFRRQTGNTRARGCTRFREASRVVTCGLRNPDLALVLARSPFFSVCQGVHLVAGTKHVGTAGGLRADATLYYAATATAVDVDVDVDGHLDIHESGTNHHPYATTTVNESLTILPPNENRQYLKFEHFK